MTTITRALLSVIQNDVLVALASVEAKHGIKFKTSKSHYSNAATGDIKLDFALLGENGIPELSDHTKGMMKYHGMVAEEVRWPAGIGRGGRRAGAWRITDYNGRAPKYPWTVSNREGEALRLPAGLARQLFGATTHIPFDPPKITIPEVPVVSPKPQREYEAAF